MIMFYPKMNVQITASAPHPEGTEYRISIGEEDWDGVFQTVTKVQMVYNGKIAGRKSPSYPFGSDDCTRVYEAIAELEEKYQNAKKKRIIEHFPAKQATYVPVDQFVELICRIPEGCITRWEDIETYFKRVYQAERIEVEHYAHWRSHKDGTEVPYWRIVGTYGYIPNDTRAGGREHQINRLTFEGLHIEPCGAENKSRRVRNYKEYLYDLSKIDDSEVKKTDFGTTIYSAAKEMFLNREIYRGLPKEMLIGIANNEYGLNENGDTANCSEYAKEELIRRGIDFQPRKGKQ